MMDKIERCQAALQKIVDAYAELAELGVLMPSADSPGSAVEQTAGPVLPRPEPLPHLVDAIHMSVPIIHSADAIRRSFEGAPIYTADRNKWVGYMHAKAALERTQAEAAAVATDAAALPPLDLDFRYNTVKRTQYDRRFSPDLTAGLNEVIETLRTEIPMDYIAKRGTTRWLDEEVRELAFALSSGFYIDIAQEAADVCGIAMVLMAKACPHRSSGELAQLMVQKWQRGGNPAKR